MNESLADRKIQGLFKVADDRYYGTLLAKVLLSREVRGTKQRRNISHEKEKD